MHVPLSHVSQMRDSERTKVDMRDLLGNKARVGSVLWRGVRASMNTYGFYELRLMVARVRASEFLICTADTPRTSYLMKYGISIRTSLLSSRTILRIAE
jgi:hypothetical protein